MIRSDFLLPLTPYMRVTAISVAQKSAVSSGSPKCQHWRAGHCQIASTDTCINFPTAQELPTIMQRTAAAFTSTRAWKAAPFGEDNAHWPTASNRTRLCARGGDPAASLAITWHTRQLLPALHLIWRGRNTMFAGAASRPGMAVRTKATKVRAARGAPQHGRPPAAVHEAGGVRSPDRLPLRYGLPENQGRGRTQAHGTASACSASTTAAAARALPLAPQPPSYAPTPPPGGHRAPDRLRQQGRRLLQDHLPREPAAAPRCPAAQRRSATAACTLPPPTAGATRTTPSIHTPLRLASSQNAVLLARQGPAV